MPAKSSGESKGLIITLVFFILASIVLGVVAYYGYADQAKLTQERKDADTKLKKMEDERNYYRFLAMQLKEYAGELQPDERQQFTVDRKDWPALADKANTRDKQSFVALFDKLDKTRKFAAVQSQSQLPFAKDVAAKTEEINTLNKSLQEAVDARGKAEADKLKAENELRAAVSKFAADLKNATDKASGELRTFSDETLKQRQDQIDQLTKKNTDLETEKAARDAEITRLREQIRKQEEIQKKVLAARTAKVDLAQNDKPKGEIYAVEGDGSTVILRLASTAHLPPQQTFSVRGMGSGGQVQPNVKGSVMVTSVLNDRLARARVTDVRDKGADPLLRGDKVFSIGWNPNLQQHVAIAGVIDLNGNGGSSAAVKNPSEAQRRMLEFKRSLENQGMVVDAYIDLINPKIVGELSIETDYLILGDIPQGVSGGGLVKEKEKEKERAEQTQDTVSDLVVRMTQDAASKGVTIVPIRKFAVMTGYRTLRTGNNEAGNYEPKPKPPASIAPVERKAPPKPDAERGPEGGEPAKPDKPEKPER
jgi:hypothetical protein